MAVEIKSALSTTNRAGQAAPGGGTFDFSYTTLEDFRIAEEARGKDLVTRDNLETLYCYDDWSAGLDSSYVSSFGWVTDATRFTQLVGVVPCQGILGQGFYLKGDYRYGIIRPYQNYFRTVDIGIENTNDQAGGYAIRHDGRTPVYHIRCVIKTLKNNCITNCVNITVQNCILISQDAGFPVIDSDAAGGHDDVYFENTVFVGGNYSVQLNAETGEFRNVIAYNYGTASLNRSTKVALARNNISADGLIASDLGITLTDADFVDPANDDYHLSQTSQAKDVGYDNSTDRGYSDDIDGDTRSAPWDVGADEVSGAAPVVGNAVIVGTNF